LCLQLSEVSVQNRYSIVDRGSDDVWSIAKRKNWDSFPWFPLGQVVFLVPRASPVA